MKKLSKSEICDKTWSTESLKELLSDMTAKNQIKLIVSGYKIKQNEVKDDNDNKTQDDKMTTAILLKIPKVLDHLIANPELFIVPDTQQTPLLPSDLSITPRLPIKSVYNDNTQIFSSLQNMFLKEK